MKRLIMGAMYISYLTFLLYLVTLMIRAFYYLFFLWFFCVPFLQHQEAFLLSFHGVTIIFRFAFTFLLDSHKIMTLYYFIIRQLQYIDTSMTLLTLLTQCPHTAQIRKRGFKGSRPAHSKFTGDGILVSFTAFTMFRYFS